MLTFTKKILNAYKRYDFESLFVIGPQGSGKTTYAMLVLYEVYKDWDKVLRYLFFDPKPALVLFKDALRSGKRVLLVVFDDAGWHLSKYLWYTDRDTAMLLNAFYNLIRTVCAGTIFTSPDMDILKELRKKSWWIGEPRAPHGKSKPDRVMVLYRKTIKATGQVFISRKAEDYYRLDMIPSDVRGEYEEMRRAAMESLIELLEENMGRLKRMDRNAEELLEKIEMAYRGGSQ